MIVESLQQFMLLKSFRAGASLVIYDPKVSEEKIKDDFNFYWKNKPLKPESRIKILNESKREFGERDIVAIITEWEEFKSFDYSKATVFDGRHILNHKIC